MILDQINKANDIHNIPLKDFPALAEEIRGFLIDHVSRTGGHLSANLGTVELTLALHNVLNFPEDKLIFDVGHQAYTHKILTGRKNEFDTLRQEGGLSGFPKRDESPCDAFDSGHSSDSISAGLGYVRARDLLGGSGRVVACIGDGALTGGMAYEAMNNAALLKTNFIIVLNDNTMSISPNVGGVSTYLGAIRTAQSYTGMKLKVTKGLNKIPKVGPKIVETVRRTKGSIKQLFIPGMMFENMGLTYLGPVDGHDMITMMRLFNEAKKVPGAVLVHVLTKKGKGYGPAEKKPDRFHGIGPFDVATGKPLSEEKGRSYTKWFQETMLELGKENPKLVAITAAMPSGTGLDAFAAACPDRFFDVGIAEEHAVSFAAGLSLGGMIPVVAVYSSFLQRGVDQIMQDVCMQNLHVIFAVDRAGIVGADGATHHGAFDLSYLTMCPNMTVMAPRDGEELALMLRYAVNDTEGPVAIRYPRGGAASLGIEPAAGRPPIARGRAEVLREGREVAVIALGSMVKTALEAAAALEKEGICPTIVNARFAKPLDEELLQRLSLSHSLIVTIEENVGSGGLGEHIGRFMALHSPDTCVRAFCLPDRFIPHGKTESLLKSCGLTSSGLSGAIREYVKIHGEQK